MKGSCDSVVKLLLPLNNICGLIFEDLINTFVIQCYADG